MTRVDMQTVQELCGELVQWLESDAPFQPSEGRKKHSYAYDGKKLPFVEKDPTTWEYCVNSKNEDTAFLDLADLLQDAEAAYVQFHSYGPRELCDYVDERCRAIEEVVYASRAVKRMASNVATIKSADIPPALVREIVPNTVNHHFRLIVKCRVLTLSRRYMPTEAIFEAYRVGLMPFGWDWDSLWCLNPASLD